MERLTVALRGGSVDGKATGAGDRAWRNFCELTREKDPDVVEGAFWVAAAEYPELDVAREVGRVRFLGAECARRVQAHANPFARVDAIREFLFGELGFRGNSLRYKDPRNSYLNEVLNRRLGIPLTLSILYLDLARASGFVARGVGLPGHFVVRLEADGRTVFVDPFHGGRVVTEDDCAELVATTTGRPSLFRRAMLRGTGERDILVRLLMNLKHIYVGEEDYARALAMVERLLALRPGDPTELRDRGFLKAHLGRPGAAIRDLESYLALPEPVPDRDSVLARVAWLRRHLTQMN